MGTCPGKCNTETQKLSLNPTYTVAQYDKDSSDLSFNIDLTADVVNPASMTLSFGRVYV